MATKSLTNIYNIFVDTGIFIDLLKTDLDGLSPKVKNRILQTNKFFEAIESLNRKITFQTSAINIAELFHCGNKHKDTMAALLSVTGSNDLEVLSFDPDVATYHNSWLGAYLGNQSIKEIKESVNYPTGGNLANVEDRIRKDMLICSTAKMYNVDVVLTNDGGFKTLADGLDLFCHCFTGNEADFITSHGGDKIYDFAK